MPGTVHTHQTLVTTTTAALLIVDCKIKERYLLRTLSTNKSTYVLPGTGILFLKSLPFSAHSFTVCRSIHVSRALTLSKLSLLSTQLLTAHQRTSSWLVSLKLEILRAGSRTKTNLPPSSFCALVLRGGTRKLAGLFLAR